jgi:hypothetical protein
MCSQRAPKVGPPAATPLPATVAVADGVLARVALAKKDEAPSDGQVPDGTTSQRPPKRSL